MKEEIEFINKDRSVNDEFKEKLEKVGLKIQLGKYEEWDNQPYVRIGRKRIWLVCTKIDRNGGKYVAYRYQNNVIEDIEKAIEIGKAKAERDDAQVDEFFKKLGLDEED